MIPEETDNLIFSLNKKEPTLTPLRNYTYNGTNIPMSKWAYIDRQEHNSINLQLKVRV